MTLSASKITTWLACPRRFKFRYVWKIPPPWKASALALGSAVHGALETFHQQRTTGTTIAPDAVAEAEEHEGQEQERHPLHRRRYLPSSRRAQRGMLLCDPFSRTLGVTGRSATASRLSEVTGTPKRR